MKIYIAGKITGKENYQDDFNRAEVRLLKKGHKVMNPSILPAGFEHAEYMKICYSMIDVCDSVYMLKDWEDSTGAKMEKEYAKIHGKMVEFEV